MSHNLCAEVLVGAAEIFVRAGELVVKRDKLDAERTGEPKVACVVKRELRSLGQEDGGVEIDGHRRDGKRIEQGESFEQRLPLGGGGANFLQARVRDFEI